MFVFATLAFVACSSLDIDEDEKGWVSFSTVEKCVSKATSSQDTKINEFQLLVFNQEGIMEAFGYSEHGEDVKLKVADQRILTCYAVVNVPISDVDLSSVKTRSELLSKTSYLRDNSLTSMQMIGSVSRQFTEGESVPISVSRFAAKVTVSEVRRNMRSESYRAQEFKVLGMYVTNVNTSCPYSLVATESATSDWLNRMGYQSSVCDALLWEGSINTEIPEGASYDTEHSFYVYPNPSHSNAQSGSFTPRYTRLVVKASLGGTVYYYVVNIKDVGSEGSLEHNHQYILNLEITGPGSLTEDDLSSNVVSGPGVRVVSWTSGPSVSDSF